MTSATEPNRLTLVTMVLALCVAAGSADAQTFRSPAGVTLAPDGSIVVADRGSHRVFRVDPNTGTATVIAGTGTPGFSGDGGPALRAEFRNPEWVDFDPLGNLWIADRGNRRVRVLRSATGTIDTVAGNGTDQATGDGGPALDAGFAGPFGLAVARDGMVYVFDTEAHSVRRIDPTTGTISTVIGDGVAGDRGEGGPGRAARLRRPHNGVVDREGRLVFGDSFNHRIKRWDPATDRIETIAGTGAEGSSAAGTRARDAPFTYFGGLAIDASGGIVFTSADNRVLRVHPQSGILERIAGEPAGTEPGTRSPTTPMIRGPYGIAITASGRIVFANGGSGSLLAVDPVTHVVKALG